VDPILGQIPIGRAGTTEDIANAAYWLASPEASYVSGVTLSVNGGWRFM
jgi:3-oxoacyl-[acyl-carrier protein] reductase